jgi:hypothetical protein
MTNKRLCCQVGTLTDSHSAISPPPKPPDIINVLNILQEDVNNLCREVNTLKEQQCLLLDFRNPSSPPKPPRVVIPPTPVSMFMPTILNPQSRTTSSLHVPQSNPSPQYTYSQVVKSPVQYPAKSNGLTSPPSMRSRPSQAVPLPVQHHESHVMKPRSHGTNIQRVLSVHPNPQGTIRQVLMNCPTGIPLSRVPTSALQNCPSIVPELNHSPARYQAKPVSITPPSTPCFASKNSFSPFLDDSPQNDDLDSILPEYAPLVVMEVLVYNRSE